MKIKTISSLIIASVLMANIASAEGVATNEADLETTTLGVDSSYTLTKGDTGSFVITKYLNEEGFIFTPIEYNLLINNPLGDDDTTVIYYKWVDNKNTYGTNEYVHYTRSLDVASEEDFDFSVKIEDNERLEVTGIYGGGVDPEGINHSFAGLFDATVSNGAAIYNTGEYNSTTEVYENGIIGNITGDFIGNYIFSTFSGNSGGAAIYNSEGEIGDIKGDFIGNYVFGSSSSASYGGAINNRASGIIGNIEGDFIGNYTYNTSEGKQSKGGAYLLMMMLQ